MLHNIFISELSDVQEKVILKQLVSYLDKHNIPRKSSGFRKYESTKDAIASSLCIPHNNPSL
jgi:hypothetical protein